MTTADTVIREFEKLSKPLSKTQWEQEKRFSPTQLQVRKISDKDSDFLLNDFLKDYSETEQAKIWIETYKKSPYRSLDSHAIDFFKQRQKCKTFPLMDFADDIFRWTKKVDCWITGDMLASLTSQIHETEPKKYFSNISILSKSKSPWQNRMSLLSLYYYSSCRKTYPSFEDSIALVEKHLSKDHYHLQKSVGWTLREMNNVYPKQTQKWLDKNICLLSPQAFTTATEKIKGPKKESWKTQRKNDRKNKK